MTHPHKYTEILVHVLIKHQVTAKSCAALNLILWSKDPVIICIPFFSSSKYNFFNLKLQYC